MTQNGEKKPGIRAEEDATTNQSLIAVFPQDTRECGQTALHRPPINMRSNVHSKSLKIKVETMAEGTKRSIKDDDEEESSNESENSEQESESESSSDDNGEADETDDVEEDPVVEETEIRQPVSSNGEPCTFDLRNLLAINAHQVDIKSIYQKPANSKPDMDKTTISLTPAFDFARVDEAYLLQKASDGCAQIVEALWQLPKEKSDAGAMVRLPMQDDSRVPRALVSCRTWLDDTVLVQL